MSKIFAYLIAMLIVPVYCAFFFMLIWDATAVKVFAADQLSLQQSYCITAISGFLTAKFDGGKNDMGEVFSFVVVYPPIAYLICLLITAML